MDRMAMVINMIEIRDATLDDAEEILKIYNY